uniref:NADH-ubiquinone oxidoreductase chain 2 n=1 Tax=Platypus contaminatus TaxID=2066526 RepID=A0A6C0RU35_9CUCU|nr:NADH dehydrogenase subunit 2 [Platypus contaminatus]QIA44528.1 NADH dehydrogenase subunit 2 [Platypus contaminatus]
MIFIISSNSWINMWIGLEINLMSTIPLLYSKNILASEASTKYFIIQAFASSIFIFSVISFPMFPSWMMFMNITLMSSLLMKLGMPPFHFWLPEISSGLLWYENMIMLIIQKIAPMMIFAYMTVPLIYMSILIILGAIVSSIQGINQTDMRKIMAYSSINHMSWMLLSMMKSLNLWMVYFLIYAMISVTVMSLLHSTKTLWLSNLSKNNKMMMMILSLNIMSMGGLPPMIGFLPKWLAIQLTIKEMMLTTFILIILSIIVLFFYMRLTISSFSLINKINNLSMKTSMNFNSLMFSTLMITLLMYTPLFIELNL